MPNQPPSSSSRLGTEGGRSSRAWQDRAPADARFILSAANMHLKLGQPTEACELYKKLESLSLTSRQSEIARSKQSVAASMTPREHQTPREQPTEAPGRPGLRSGASRRAQ